MIICVVQALIEGMLELLMLGLVWLVVFGRTGRAETDRVDWTRLALALFAAICGRDLCSNYSTGHLDAGFLM